MAPVIQAVAPAVAAVTPLVQAVVPAAQAVAVAVTEPVTVAAPELVGAAGTTAPIVAALVGAPAVSSSAAGTAQSSPPMLPLDLAGVVAPLLPVVNGGIDAVAAATGAATTPLSAVALPAIVTNVAAPILATAATVLPSAEPIVGALVNAPPLAPLSTSSTTAPVPRLPAVPPIAPATVTAAHDAPSYAGGATPFYTPDKALYASSQPANFTAAGGSPAAANAALAVGSALATFSSTSSTQPAARPLAEHGGLLAGAAGAVQPATLVAAAAAPTEVRFALTSPPRALSVTPSVEKAFAKRAGEPYRAVGLSAVKLAGSAAVPGGNLATTLTAEPRGAAPVALRRLPTSAASSASSQPLNGSPGSPPAANTAASAAATTGVSISGRGAGGTAAALLPLALAVLIAAVAVRRQEPVRRLSSRALAVAASPD